jgi:hypothetical protein
MPYEGQLNAIIQSDKMFLLLLWLLMEKTWMPCSDLVSIISQT